MTSLMSRLLTRFEKAVRRNALRGSLDAARALEAERELENARRAIIAEIER